MHHKSSDNNLFFGDCDSFTVSRGLCSINADLSTCSDITLTDSIHALLNVDDSTGFLGNVSILRNSLVLVRQLYTWTLMGNNDRAASNWICRWTALLMVWTELFLSAIIPVTSTQNIKCPRCSTNSFRARSASVENDAGRPTQNMKVLCGWWIVVIHYRYIDVERYQKCNTQGTMRFKCTISIL